jgi:RNA recognition motif-containing protein
MHVIGGNGKGSTGRSVAFAITGLVWFHSCQPCYQVGNRFIPAIMPEKAVFSMEARLYVGNLSKSTTQEELNTLFSQAGNVTAVEVIKERKSGESKGFGFITMSEQSEADKAISMFDTYSLGDHALKVGMAKPRE